MNAVLKQIVLPGTLQYKGLKSRLSDCSCSPSFFWVKHQRSSVFWGGLVNLAQTHKIATICSRIDVDYLLFSFPACINVFLEIPHFS